MCGWNTQSQAKIKTFQVNFSAFEIFQNRRQIVKDFFAPLLLAVSILLTSSHASAYTVFWLSSTPEDRSDCSNVNIYACRAIDDVQASGYVMARRGQISWVQMVDRYYRERSRIFPSMRDDHVTAEIRAYQRVLAERRDAGKITESEWVFLLAKQFSVLTTRENQSQSARQQNQQMQQLRSDQASYEQQQQMNQANIEQQQMLQNQRMQQQIDQQRMQQQQMEQQQNWQRMQQR